MCCRPASDIAPSHAHRLLQNTSSQRMCSNCPTDKRQPAKERCTNCAADLCLACSAQLHANPVLANHSRSPLDAVASVATAHDVTLSGQVNPPTAAAPTANQDLSIWISLWLLRCPCLLCVQWRGQASSTKLTNAGQLQRFLATGSSLKCAAFLKSIGQCCLRCCISTGQNTESTRLFDRCSTAASCWLWPTSFTFWTTKTKSERGTIHPCSPNHSASRQKDSMILGSSLT